MSVDPFAALKAEIERLKAGTPPVASPQLLAFAEEVAREIEARPKMAEHEIAQWAKKLADEVAQLND